jgi:hypothetical protein
MCVIRALKEKPETEFSLLDSAKLKECTGPIRYYPHRLEMFAKATNAVKGKCINVSKAHLPLPYVTLSCE